ncbi:MAG: hypothetical protein KF746_10440 [Chitinophagaceae bacterium]|nr:hypothetical protein [Chitinophagaceae bacterium]
MKQIVMTFLFSATVSTWALGQKPGKDEVNLSDPFQIDSSDYFLIPELIDNDNQQAYGKGKGYLPWGNYSHIIFYNAKTNQSKKLFKGQLALIAPFYSGRYYYDDDREKEVPANILSKHIVYLARTDNFNGDHALDTDDPVYLYISTKAGDNLKQITPKGFNVISWTVSKDRKMLLVKGQNDKNGNKKFGNGDDELYYRIDLDDDVSKIQCYQINL